MRSCQLKNKTSRFNKKGCAETGSRIVFALECDATDNTGSGAAPRRLVSRVVNGLKIAWN